MFITLLLHVALTVPPSFSPAVARIAVTEAADIWTPYGVAVDLAGPCGWAPDGTTVLHLVAAEARRATVSTSGGFSEGRFTRPLGAITFAPDGTPGPVITVFVSDLLLFVSRTRVLGAAEWQWPRRLRDLVIGRALGRVLAHEIGHFLLHMPQHTAGGLMRPVERAEDLVSPTRGGFTLSPAETQRLR